MVVKRMPTRPLLHTFVALLLVCLAGCTIGAEPGTPTLATTTSAEQTQRIFWNDVKNGKWQTVQSLLVANVVWRNGKDVLTRDQIVPYLQRLQVKDVLITNLTVRANQNAMTVVYDLQMMTGGSAQPLNMHAIAVWQQVPPPPDNATKQQKKQAMKEPPYLLTVEDLAADATP
jgi:hypothetical protein